MISHQTGPLNTRRYPSDCEMELAKLRKENTRLLCKIFGHRWDYSFDDTPDSFGYSECFRPLCRIDEPAGSPFYHCALLVISEKANG